MKKRFCQLCNTTIAPGGQFYIWRMEFASGTDAFLPEIEDPDGYINETLKELEGKSEEELLDDIFQKMKFVICRACCLKVKRQLTKMKKHKGKIVPFPLQYRK